MLGGLRIGQCKALNHKSNQLLLQRVSLVKQQGNKRNWKAVGNTVNHRYYHNNNNHNSQHYN
eukprot:Pgem_evm1s19854